MSSNLKKSLVFCASALILCGFGGLVHQNNHVNADEVSDLTFQQNRPDFEYFDKTNKGLKSDFKTFRTRALNEAKNGVPEAKEFTHNKYIYNYLRKQGYTNHQINYGEFHKISESHQKQFGYHEGIPKPLTNTNWHSAKHYIPHHSQYRIVHFYFNNYAPESGETIYNRHGKDIGDSSGSGSAWNAYYRYLGHHTYFIVSGIGDFGSYAKLTKHNILHSASMMTSVKLLKHHRALINGNYYTLTKRHSKHIRKINKHTKKSKKHVRKSTKRTKHNHKVSHHRK